MIDQETDEILSRYLDGDLDSDESRVLSERLKSDPALQETLDEMVGLRRHLRRVALEDRPPEVLDHLVRPLRRAGRPRKHRWSAVALVAAAAVVVVGLIVVSEVGRNGWLPWSSKSGDDEIFQLSNLPTRDPDAPLGAIETLMAGADAEPDLVEPEVLDIMGPLQQPPENQPWMVLLQDGEIVIPLSGNVQTQGLIVVVRVEDGRVTSCRPADGSEEVDTGDICSQVVSIEDIELADGDHHGLVARRENIGTPASERSGHRSDPR